MKISTQAIKFINEHYGSAGDPAPEGVDALVQTIGAQLAAVEEVVDFGTRFEPVVIVRVVSCEDHPNADRLHICKVDDGRKIEGVERDSDGLVQVICGAPNVHAGMFAAWLPPGSTVPNTFDKDPFVLEAREIRGTVSNGMMASPRELTLGDSHEGILEIDADYPGVEPGARFADVYQLRGDYIIDMENKMFTHRPDCFGWLGLARELEGIQHRLYRSPDWYVMNPEIPGIEADELPFEVVNELPELVPRFTAIALRDVQIKPSPVWLQVALARAGMKSINNIVDYSNFFMLLTGQPIHIYDYDKVKAFCSGDKAVLTVRHPRENETIMLLNGKEITPRKEAMMVAAGDHLACVGGAMGGSDTEVSAETTNIIIEAANWDMFSMRRTSMEHGIFTDAVTRFTKGQSPLQNLATVAKIVDEIRKFAGGKIASHIVDTNHVHEDVMARASLYPAVTLTAQFVNERLGWDLSASEMANLLTNVEFGVDVEGDSLTIVAPFWRTDIEIPEDIVEEIGRLYGYDHLPLDLPLHDITPAAKNPVLVIKSKVREVLSQAGANELLTYSFVHGNLFEKVGQNREQAFQLANALSPELQYYRLSMTPSLLEKVHANIKSGYDTFGVFETGKIHNKDAREDEGLPHEAQVTAFVFAVEAKTARQYSGAPYYQARKYLMELLANFNAINKLTFESLKDAEVSNNPWLQQMTAPYEPNRSAVLQDKEGRIWGVVGEFRPNVRKYLKLPEFCAGFEIDPLVFMEGDPTREYVQLPRFPKVEQDICLRVPSDTTYQQVFDFVWDHLQEHRPDATYHTLGPVDIYQRDDVHKQITLRLGIASFDRTLTDDEVNSLLDDVAAAAHAELQAERV